MRSVDIGSLELRPLPAEMLDKVGCTHCQGRSARWELPTKVRLALNFLCSTCFLYEHPILKDQREGVDFVTSGVERSVGRTFARDDQGRLVEAEDSDRIATGIVMAQRYELARGLK